MPKLVASSGSVITTAPGAHHYRFTGIEISPTPGTFLYNLILLGSPDGSAAGLPHDIIFDRSYLHGDPAKGTRRGIALNSRATAVIDFHLSDFKEVGADSQAICGWNGPGPFKIVNNYLEGAGENVIVVGVARDARGEGLGPHQMGKFLIVLDERSQGLVRGADRFDELPAREHVFELIEQHAAGV